MGICGIVVTVLKRVTTICRRAPTRLGGRCTLAGTGAPLFPGCGVPDVHALTLGTSLQRRSGNVCHLSSRAASGDPPVRAGASGRRFPG